MSTTFQIAVITLAVFVGVLATLGFFVVVKIFMGAFRIQAQVKGIPQALAQKEQQLIQATRELVAERERMAAEKAQALEAAAAKLKIVGLPNASTKP